MKVLRMGKEILPAVFSVIFEATSKFLIVFVRLILRKVGTEGFTRSGQQIDIRYEFEHTFKGFRV